MGYDEKKNASRIVVKVATSKVPHYSGVELLRIAEVLATDLTVDESTLAERAGVPPGYNNSGVGDLKRLILSLWNKKPKENQTNR